MVDFSLDWFRGTGSSRSDSLAGLSCNSDSSPSDVSCFSPFDSLRGSALNNSLAVVKSNSSANELLTSSQCFASNLVILSRISSFRHEIPILEMVSFC
ncbi:hypothetical protein OGATHE_006046 [Ogataea polymorpha]|uniref:Uncharacterized protein n=1 Tax=Ogataea polymorpha TaxID=460523 RepID=A0A9P8SXN6_9ASCO|nr:hypothetical protein OGATHE_006046 [Ogataea polymorpha]